MKKQDVWKSKTYRELLKHYLRVNREKRDIENSLKKSQEDNTILKAAIEGRRCAMVFVRFV